MSGTISVQARLGSTRLPGKVLMHIAEKRVLDWVVERCKGAENPNVVVAVGDNPENKAITELCRRKEYRFLEGPEEDLLERHLMVTRETNADFLVRVTGDCPFVPSAEIDRMVDLFRQTESDYVTNVTEGMPVGTAVDVVSTNVLEELSSMGETHPVGRLREEPGEWNVESSGNPDWHAVGDAHIAVDTPDDYWTLTDAVEAVGPDPFDVAEWVSTQN